MTLVVKLKNLIVTTKMEWFKMVSGMENTKYSDRSVIVHATDVLKILEMQTVA